MTTQHAPTTIAEIAAVGKIIPLHKITLSSGKVATFSSLAELGGLIQCHGGKPSTIALAHIGSDGLPNVVIPVGQEKRFAGVAKFRASKFCKSLS